jgi:hypothetical protein
MSIKVLIADSHPVLRSGLTAYLEEQPDICVVAQGERHLRERLGRHLYQPPPIHRELCAGKLHWHGCQRWAKSGQWE